MMTVGFDPARGRFVGTFVSSMMTHLWPYDGSLDVERNILSLESEGPSFAGDGTTAKYIDAIELVSDDHRILRASVVGGDGTRNEFMVAHYRRVGR